jgi:hypothetical protein
VISTGFAHDGPAVTDAPTDRQELVMRLYVHMGSKILAESSETEQVKCRCAEFLRDSVRPVGATDSVLTVALNQMTSSPSGRNGAFDSLVRLLTLPNVCFENHACDPGKIYLRPRIKVLPSRGVRACCHPFN